MAQRSWHQEVKTGPSSLLTIMLRSSSLWTCKLHPWLFIHCTGFALAFFSYNHLHTELRTGAMAAHSWLPCFLPTHLRCGARWQREGAVLQGSASQLFSCSVNSWETDRSESKKQRLQTRRLTALILHVLSAGKIFFCNSEDTFTNNLQFRYEFGAYMDGSWLIAERSSYYGTCSTT